MAYRVVKKVKGKSYAYLQRSFRAGGKVCTVSLYIGPVDGADASPKKGTKTQKRASASSPKPEGGGGNSPPVPTSELPDTVRNVPTKAVRAVAEECVRIDARLERKGLSERAARRQHANMAGALSNLGIPGDRIPFVAARFGSKLGVKPRWRGGFVVTVPRFDRVKRRDVQAAFRLALGRAALEALRTRKPELFGRFSLVMDKSFHRTSAALFSYVRAGGHPDAWAWWVAHRFLGYANPLPGRKAEEIGLVGYGARKSWTDDAAGIVGELVAFGPKAAAARADREVERAKAAEARATAALRAARGVMGLIRRPELRRRLRVAVARRSATEEAAINVNVVRFFLNGERAG